MSEQPTDDDMSETEYQALIATKGRRARRREFDATRDPGHLHVWFNRQGYPSYDDPGLFRQIVRSWRHSCHSACCAMDAYIKRHDNRTQRQKVKQELRKQR